MRRLRARGNRKRMRKAPSRLLSIQTGLTDSNRRSTCVRYKYRSWIPLLIFLPQVPEFVPASSRAASRCPSESAPSEYDYQSDTLSLPYRTMPRAIPSRAGTILKFTFFTNETIFNELTTQSSALYTFGWIKVLIFYISTNRPSVPHTRVGWFDISTNPPLVPSGHVGWFSPITRAHYH